MYGCATVGLNYCLNSFHEQVLRLVRQDQAPSFRKHLKKEKSATSYKKKNSNTGDRHLNGKTCLVIHDNEQ